MALPILWQFFDRWGSAEVTRTADWRQIAELMHPLGLYEKRAKMLIRFSGVVFLLCKIVGIILTVNIIKKVRMCKERLSWNIGAILAKCHS